MCCRFSRKSENTRGLRPSKDPAEHHVVECRFSRNSVLVFAMAAEARLFNLLSYRDPCVSGRAATLFGKPARSHPLALGILGRSIARKLPADFPRDVQSRRSPESAT